MFFPLYKAVMLIPPFTRLYEELDNRSCQHVDSAYAQVPAIVLYVHLWKEVGMGCDPLDSVHAPSESREFGRLAGGTEPKASEELAWNTWQKKAPSRPMKLFTGYNGASWADCLGLCMQGGSANSTPCISEPGAPAADRSCTSRCECCLCLGALGLQRVPRDGFISGVQNSSAVYDSESTGAPPPPLIGQRHAGAISPFLFFTPHPDSASSNWMPNSLSLGEE